jgi:hypothetical protein
MRVESVSKVALVAECFVVMMMMMMIVTHTYRNMLRCFSLTECFVMVGKFMRGRGDLSSTGHDNYSSIVAPL